MGAEVMAVNLGRAVATRAAMLWLARRNNEQERRMEMGELIRRRVPGLRMQRSLERQFEEIADVIADRIEPMCLHEFRGLDDGERQAAIDAMTSTFANADLSDAAVLGSDANPVELVRRIRAAARPPVGLSEPATAFYDLLLIECCDCYVQILRRLPVFTERAITEVLARMSQFGGDMRLILERLPIRSLYAPHGDDQDEEFLHEYLDLVSQSLDEVEMFSFSSGRWARTKLSVAYISLQVNIGAGRTSPKNTAVFRNTRNRGNPADWEEVGQKSAGMRIEEALRDARRILLRGEAGSGKTTLLRWLAISASRGAFTGGLAEWNGLVPIIVKLRQYASRDLPTLNALLDGVAGPITAHMPSAWMDRQFKAGRVLLMVDGVDELLPSERRKVRQWLKLLLVAYPDTRVLVTSRPAAARADWLQGEEFSSVYLERMTPPDLRAFIRQWHQAVAAHGDELPCQSEDLPHYERALVTSLQDRPHLQQLAANPLLAAMLCALHLARRRQLPRNRMEMYQTALELLVQRRDAERQVPSASSISLSLTDKLCVLRDLAWRLSDNGLAELGWGKARTYVTAKVNSMRHLTVDGDQVLDHLVDRSGVLRSPAEGRLDFLHRTFQEYLAAAEAISEDRIGNLIERAHRDQWRETIIMAAGHANRSQRRDLLAGILNRAQDEPRHTRMLNLLAASCLETMESIPDEIAQELDRTIDRLVPPRRKTETQSLAAVGEPLLSKFPRALNELSDAAACATIQAAALIGGPIALDLLVGYTADERSRLQYELVRAWKYFDSDDYAHRVLTKLPLEKLELYIAHPTQWRPMISRLCDVHDLYVGHRISSEFALIRELPHLKKLWIPHFWGESDLSPLRDLPELRELYLNGDVPLEDVTPLVQLSKLDFLYLLGWSPLLQPEQIPLPETLTALGLGRLPAGTDLQFLKNHLNLELLSLECEGQPHGIEVLCQMRELFSLTLYGVDLQDQLAEIVSVKPRLNSILFNKCILPRDLSPLRKLNALKELHLLDCVGPNGDPLDVAPLSAIRKISISREL